MWPGQSCIYKQLFGTHATTSNGSLHICPSVHISITHQMNTHMLTGIVHVHLFINTHQISSGPAHLSISPSTKSEWWRSVLGQMDMCALMWEIVYWWTGTGVVCHTKSESAIAHLSTCPSQYWPSSTPVQLSIPMDCSMRIGLFYGTDVTRYLLSRQSAQPLWYEHMSCRDIGIPCNLPRSVT